MGGVGVHRKRNTRNQRQGAISEGVIKNRLTAMGLLLVQKIEVPFVKSGNGWIRKRCRGDFNAVHESGRYVHIEAKSSRGSLSYTAIQHHQRIWLDEYKKAGAISLLVWLDMDTMNSYILEWPVPGFSKGTPLKPVEAMFLAVKCRNQMKELGERND